MKTYVRVCASMCACVFVRQHAKRTTTTTGHKTQSQVNYRLRPYLRCRKFGACLFPLSRAPHTAHTRYVPSCRGQCMPVTWQPAKHFSVAVICLQKLLSHVCSGRKENSDGLLLRQRYRGDRQQSTYQQCVSLYTIWTFISNYLVMISCSSFFGITFPSNSSVSGKQLHTDRRQCGTKREFPQTSACFDVTCSKKKVRLIFCKLLKMCSTS